MQLQLPKRSYRQKIEEERNYLLIIDISVFGGHESHKSSPDSSNKIRDGRLAFKVRNYFCPSLVKVFLVDSHKHEGLER